MMKQRTRQACSLKHSIQKGMLFALGKMKLFKLGKVEVQSLPLYIFRCYSLALFTQKFSYLASFNESNKFLLSD